MTKERYILYASVLTATFGYIFNFDSAVISSSLVYLGKNFNIDQEHLGKLITVSLIGSLIGGVISGYFSEKIGRKNTILSNQIIFLIGGLTASFSKDLHMFYLGRVLMGFSLGSLFLVGGMYIVEISPAKNRGRNSSIRQLLLPVGLITGFTIVYILTNYLSKLYPPPHLWRFLFLLEVIQMGIIFLLFIKVPESPRWLFKKGKHEKAKKSLENFLEKEQVEKVFQEMELSLNKKSEEKLKVNKGIIIVLLLAAIFPFFKQMSGINPIIYYAPRIFEEMSTHTTSGYLQSILLGFFQIVGSVITMVCIDRYGRKKLLFLGAFGMTLALGYISYSLMFDKKGVLEIASIYLYSVTYTMSLGTILSVYISEVIPTSVRAIGATLFSFFNYVFDIILTDLFLGVSAGHPYLPFLIFFITSGTLLFFLNRIPETKGKTLEEIQIYWDSIK